MAARHRMTPARRAALRKAQLASARKRRKSGVRSAVKRSASQSRDRRRANRALAANRKKKTSSRRKIARAAVVVSAASVAAAAGAGAARGRSRPKAPPRRAPIKVESTRPAVTGREIPALEMGPKGKAAVRSRRYRQRQKLKRDGLYRVNPRYDYSNPG